MHVFITKTGVVYQGQGQRIERHANTHVKESTLSPVCAGRSEKVFYYKWSSASHNCMFHEACMRQDMWNPTRRPKCSVVISAVLFIHTSLSEGCACVLSLSDTAQRGQCNTNLRWGEASVQCFICWVYRRMWTSLKLLTLTFEQVLFNSSPKMWIMSSITHPRVVLTSLIFEFKFSIYWWCMHGDLYFKKTPQTYHKRSLCDWGSLTKIIHEVKQYLG